MKFHQLAPGEIDWDALDRFEDRVFSQRRHWLAFVTSFVRGEVIVAELRDLGSVLGYFTGIRSRIYGVPILGSPYRGWLTAHMGFNLAPGVPRIEALQALGDLAFKQLGCLSSRSEIQASGSRRATTWDSNPASGPPTCPT